MFGKRIKLYIFGPMLLLGLLLFALAFGSGLSMMLTKFVEPTAPSALPFLALSAGLGVTLFGLAKVAELDDD